MPFPVHIAAIDAGSNAIRLVIARAESPFELHELATERVPVRLGHHAFTRHVLHEETIARAAKAFRQFRDLMDRYRVEAFRAVATSAAREARNRRLLIERIERKSGIRLEVVGGEQEACLVRAAVLSALEGKPAPEIILDLGGGSLEISLMRDGAVQKSVNLPVGTVRLMETLGISGRIGAEQAEAIRRLIHSGVSGALGNRANDSAAVAVACGGNAEALAHIAPAARRRGIDMLDLRQLRQRLPELTGRDVEGRMRTFRVRRDRAEVLGIAAVIFDTLHEALGVRSLLVPGVGVREGVLLELLRSRFAAAAVPEPRDERARALLAGAVWFARRFEYDAAHASHVAGLALSMFDQLRPVHRMDGEMRLVLEIAGLLHDIGRFVNPKSHHRHGEYLVRSGEIPGLRGWRQEMVACLVRYHNHKSEPDLDHKPYAALDREQRRHVRQLASLLRLAEGLEVGHRQGVTRLRATYRGRHVEFEVTARENPQAALIAARRRAALFEREFHAEAVLRKGVAGRQVA